MYSRILVQPPVEPLSLAEVKLDRALEHSLHDDLLASLIVAAREHCENFCARSLVTQTRETAFDGFALPLSLPFGPVQAVIAVEYTAADATVTAITDYQSGIGEYAGVVPAFGGAWPSSLGADLDVVKVRYIAGYDPAAGSPTDYLANVPRAFKVAMKLLVGNWYENREASVALNPNTPLPLGVESLLTPYRLRTSMA